MTTLSPILVVVEDEPGPRDQICSAAEKLGFRVKSFSNAARAMEAITAAHHHHELAGVVTDLKLAGDTQAENYSGYEVIASTSELSALIPIALYTSYPQENAVRALTARAIVPGFSLIPKRGRLRPLKDWLEALAEKTIPQKTHSFNTDRYTRDVLSDGALRVSEFGHSVIFWGEAGTGKADIAFRFAGQITGESAPHYIDLSVVRADEYERFLFGEIRESTTREEMLEPGALLRSCGYTDQSIIVGKTQVKSFVDEFSLGAAVTDSTRLQRIGRGIVGRSLNAIVIDNLQLLPDEILSRLLNSFLKGQLALNGEGVYVFPLRSFLVGCYTVPSSRVSKNNCDALEFLRIKARECEVSLLEIPALRQLTTHQLRKLVRDVADANSIQITDDAEKEIVSSFRPTMESHVEIIKDGNLRALQTLLRISSVICRQSDDAIVTQSCVQKARAFYHENDVALAGNEEIREKVDLDNREALQSTFQDLLEEEGVPVRMPIKKAAFEQICRENEVAVGRAIVSLLWATTAGHQRQTLFDDLIYSLTGAVRKHDYFTDLISLDVLAAIVRDLQGLTDAPIFENMDDVFASERHPNVRGG